MSPATRSRRAPGGSAAASADVFAALGDPTRLHVVARLCAEGPLPIVRLTKGSKLTRQAIAKHLNVLARAGLLRGYRRGRERLWEVEADRLEVARTYLDRVSRRWDDTLDRLKAAVEG